MPSLPKRRHGRYCHPVLTVFVFTPAFWWITSTVLGQLEVGSRRVARLEVQVRPTGRGATGPEPKIKSRPEVQHKLKDLEANHVRSCWSWFQLLRLQTVLSVLVLFRLPSQRPCAAQATACCCVRCAGPTRVTLSLSQRIRRMQFELIPMHPMHLPNCILWDLWGTSISMAKMILWLLQFPPHSEQQHTLYLQLWWRRRKQYNPHLSSVFLSSTAPESSVVPNASAVLAVSAVQALAERCTSGGTWREATLRPYKQVRSSEFKNGQVDWKSEPLVIIALSSCKEQACTILKIGYKMLWL